MALVSTIGNSLFLTKPTRIIITMLKKGANGLLEKDTTSYALDNIVADTTEIAQEEAERNAIDAETRDEALFETVSNGALTFTAESADWQDTMLEKVYGFVKSGDIYGLPAAYTERFAEIEVQFGDANDTDNYKMSIVLPKVLLDSTVSLSSLKTDIGRFTVSGTAYSLEVGTTNKITTALYMSKTPVTTVGV